jgi:ParB family chromosome partitioning protein
MNLSEQTNISVDGAGSTVAIPFNKLHISSKNTSPDRHTLYNIQCRAASIKAHGLLNALTVITEPVPGTVKEFGVVAGAGRYLSIELLVQNGEMPPDFLVKCELRAEEEAIALSLAENSNRTEVHEADEFVAFKKLADQGLAMETIAAHFGIPVRTVQQRLRLAALRPDLIAAYRRGEMNAEAVRAFCRSSDQERQLQVWNALPQYNRMPYHIKSHLAQDSVGTDNKLVAFVGLDAYREAGGTVTVDLFSERDDGRIEDLALLHQLAVDKMQQVAGEIVKKEGWAWSDVVETFTHGQRVQFVIFSPERREPTEQEQAKLARLRERRDELTINLDTLYAAQEQCDGEAEEYEAGEGDQNAANTANTADELAEQIKALEAQLAEVDGQLDVLDQSLLVFPDEVLARAGVIVSLDHSGAPVVTRGLIKPEDAADDQPTGSSPAASGAVAPGTARSASSPGARAAAIELPKTARPDISEKLALQLSAHRTAVLQAAMINNPRVALAAAVQRMLGLVAAPIRYCSQEEPVKISATSSLFSLESKAPDLKGSRASEEVHARIAVWRERLPTVRKGELAWLLSLPAADLTDLFSLCVAVSLDVTTGMPRTPDKQPGAELAAALQIDTASYWRATEASYLGAVSKAKIIEAVEEACGRGSGMPIASMKKGDAVKYAEKKLEGTRWLPPMLRDSVTEAAPQAESTPATEGVSLAEEPSTKVEPGTNAPQVGDGDPDGALSVREEEQATT